MSSRQLHLQFTPSSAPAVRDIDMGDRVGEARSVDIGRVGLDQAGGLHVVYSCELGVTYATFREGLDGIDQNCDGVDGVDADGDGHASRDPGGDDADDLDSGAW